MKCVRFSHPLLVCFHMLVFFTTFLSSYHSCDSLEPYLAENWFYVDLILPTILKTKKFFVRYPITVLEGESDSALQKGSQHTQLHFGQLRSPPNLTLHTQYMENQENGGIYTLASYSEWEGNVFHWNKYLHSIPDSCLPYWTLHNKIFFFQVLKNSSYNWKYSNAEKEKIKMGNKYLNNTW